MQNLSFPDTYEHDCKNCQGLCCVDLRLTEAKFPIYKDPGVACPNLETDSGAKIDQFRCRIHDKLEATGWSSCTTYTCSGAGQMLSVFLRDLGLNWAKKDEAMSLEEYKLYKKNKQLAFVFLQNLMNSLQRKTLEYGEEAVEDLKMRIKPLIIYIEQTIIENTEPIDTDMLNTQANKAILDVLFLHGMGIDLRKFR